MQREARCRELESGGGLEGDSGRLRRKRRPGMERGVGWCGVGLLGGWAGAAGGRAEESAKESLFA